MKKLAIIAVALMTSLGGMSPAAAFEVKGQHYDAPPDVRRPNWDRCGPYRNCYGNRDRYRYGNRGRDYYGRYDDRYYRHHDNTGAIIGGLAAGAIIGGIIASQPRVRSGGSHVDYCYSRYRSYRASDNTYQPNYGPRRQCVGP
ncbi:BA14K family protein [Rhizobium sp.]|uniref:BA14K family protein n=1 Tax=Rhizobium sp. TaxID=391 RepID=UPI000DB99902